MSQATDLLAMLNGLPDSELISYTPSGGSPREIRASVLRAEPVSEFVGGGEAPVRRYQLTVANHATLGITAPKPGFDTVSLKVHVGDGSPSAFRLSRILFEDEGALTLEVVK
ncbi:MAG: hypothetical protein AB7T38_02465 [Nitrospirales bacterium]